jgi:hypothetical protein
MNATQFVEFLVIETKRLGNAGVMLKLGELEALLAHLKEVESEILELQDRLRAAEVECDKFKYVSGVMHCAKCKFQHIKTNLNMSAGTVTAGNSDPAPCPNGCGPLWRTSWEDYANQHYESALSCLSRAEAAEAELQKAQARIEEATKLIREQRVQWCNDNDPGDGTDCVSPFDCFLYNVSNIPQQQEQSSNLRDQLQIALGCLADIHVSSDMTLEIARNKSRRIYQDISIAIGDAGPEEFDPQQEQSDNAAKAKVIIYFLGNMIGDLVRNTVKDNYGIDTPSLAEEMGEEFLRECSRPKPQCTVPDGWKDQWKTNVMLLWKCARKHDSSIPDDQLDFMRDFLLSSSPEASHE